MTQDPHLDDWLTALGDAVATGTFVKLTLNKPTGAAEDLKSIDIRPITVKRMLKLSFTYHYKTRDIVKNYTPAESMGLLAELLATLFTAARLYTLSADLHISGGQGKWVITRHTPTQTTPPELSHDRAKQRVMLSTGKPYLHALGITDAKGNVYKTTQDKFRQIGKYIEILDGLINKLTKYETLRVVDMGAGKGYLTFALYDYLTTRGINAEVVGVEHRADLVEHCNSIAQASQFKGLRFVQGSIANYDCAGSHVVIALHACDTATDDTINKAIRAAADLIVVAPCCHKQVRKAMTSTSKNHPLEVLLQYGTYVERLAEMVTDGMRAQLMELSGYQTNLFEFIADAHTPKNVMIVALKSPTPMTAKQHAALSASLASIKAQFGVTHHALEQLLSK